MSSFVYKVDLLYKNIQINKFDDIQGIFSGTLVGYGNRDRQGDIILTNACKDSIYEWETQAYMIPALYEHQKDMIISENMLEVEDEEEGVKITFRVSDSFKQNFPKEYELMKSSYYNGKAFFSVGINPAKSVYEKIDNGQLTRYIFDKLFINEGSFTTNPANPMAKVDLMKSMNGSIDMIEILKNITNVSSASSNLYKMAGGNISHEQCDKFIKHIFDVAKEKNTNPAKDFISEPVKAQNNDPLYDLLGF